jgi:pyrimidine deaminase RibD-like protein
MAVSRARSNAEAAERAAHEEALRKRAARQAAARIDGEVVPDPVVECVVLPQGDGKISMGEHIGGLGTAHYEEGEKFSIAVPVAVSLYDRGYVNFEGAKQASAEAKAERVRLANEARAAAQAALDANEDA